MTGASRPLVRGWCPGALRPMLSGDGYVVRIRPRSGRVSAAQLHAIAELSHRHGNGLIDFSNRANIQLRGVSETSHPALVEALAALDLVDDTAARERTRNILVTPFWREGDGTIAIAEDLAARLADGPDLPGKFGFAVDTGPTPVLADASADIRIERAASGSFLLRADGLDEGTPVGAQEAAEKAVALAEWFLASGGAPDGRGRMARHLKAGARLPNAFAPCLPSAGSQAEPCPGPVDAGTLLALPFGQAGPDQIKALAALAPAFRLTPWRMVLAEGMTSAPDIEGIIPDPANPLLAVHACTGAPDCPQALGPTRSLARALAPSVPAGSRLHVSGCTKACAHVAAASFTLTATATGYDLVQGGQCGDAPIRSGLTAEALVADPSLVFGIL